MTKKSKKRKTLEIIFAVVIIIFAIALVVAGLYWSKLDLIQYDDGTNTSVDDLSAPQFSKTDKEDSEEGKEQESEDDTKEEKIEQIVSETVVEKLEETPQDVVAPKVETMDKKYVLNVLLIATDESSKTFTNNANSDCMMIVSINKRQNTIKMVSLERGTGVPITIGQYAGEYEWLNNMVRIGGPGFLQKTIQECFRVELEGYIRVNPYTFIQVVDGCGGVDLSISEAEADYLNEHLEKKGYHFEAGLNHFDGKAAEEYGRCRKIDSDWQRIGRQRTVIQAAISKAKGVSLGELNSMLNNVLPYVQTNLTKGQITELILQVPSIAGKTAGQMTLPQEGTYSIMQNKFGKNMFSTDFETNAKALQDFLYN